MSVKTQVPGVRKDLIYGGKGPPPQFLKNTKALFHFRSIKLNPDGSIPDGEDQIKAHVIDDTRTMGCGPFELLIGRKFKMDVWEDLVKEMLIGEVARFTCPYKLVSEYPTIAQALRKVAKQKLDPTGYHNDAHRDHTHRCGFSAMMHGSGHKDLDMLTQERSPLAFEIELLKVEAPGQYEQDVWAMNSEEKEEQVPILKEEGNALYKSGDYQGAAGKYFKALGYLESVSIHEKPLGNEWKRIEDIKVPLLLNYSQCLLLMEDYLEVIKHTSQVLELDPENVKGLFRRGKAYAANWCQEEAERDFKRALELDPSLKKTIDKEMKTLTERMRAKEREDRERFQGKLF